MLKLLLKNVEEILFGWIFFFLVLIPLKWYQNMSGFAGDILAAKRIPNTGKLVKMVHPDFFGEKTSSLRLRKLMT